MGINHIVQFAKAASTVLRETFAAPTSGSYVLQNGEDQVVLRQGGEYPQLDLSGYDLSGLDLHGTNLSGANLSGANLTNTNFTGSNLTATDFDGAIIDNAKFDDAVVEDASFNDMKFVIPPSGIFMGGKETAR